MNKVQGMVLVFLLTIATVATQVPAQPSTSPRPQAERRAQDFGFRFEFGCDVLHDIYDSFSRTFVRTLEKEHKVRVVLSAQQMDQIYRAIRDIDFFNYPESFSGVPEGLAEYITTNPRHMYLLEVRNNGAVHRVRWNDGTRPWTDQAVRIRSLFLLIADYLQARPDVARLPGYACE